MSAKEEVVSRKISIITVVLNDFSGIQKTVNSVLEQDYPSVEYIVLDGGSTDGTVAILEGYKDQIDVLISEPDGGIYQAMNRGVALTSGEWVAFINSSDSFVNESVISRVFGSSDDSYDVIYGNNFYIKNANRVLQGVRPLKDFYKGMPFNHQSCFVSAKLMKARPFEYRLYKIQCEYNFLFGIFLDGYRFHYVDVNVANYLAGGFSDQHFIERALERWIINKRLTAGGDDVDRYYVELINKYLIKVDMVKPTLVKKSLYYKLKKKVRRLYERLPFGFGGDSEQE